MPVFGEAQSGCEDANFAGRPPGYPQNGLARGLDPGSNYVSYGIMVIAISLMAGDLKTLFTDDDDFSRSIPALLAAGQQLSSRIRPGLAST